MQGKRKRRQTRSGAKQKVTVPAEPKQDDPIERYSGILTGVYEAGYLEKLRDEWD